MWISLLAVLIAVRSEAQTGPQQTSHDFEVLYEQTGKAGTFSALADSPGAVFAQQTGTPAQPSSAAAPCPTQASSTSPIEAASAAGTKVPPCGPRATNPYKRFLDNGKPSPMTPRQKGALAIHDVIDPFNLLTIVANSAFTIGLNSHTGYGPGMRGFGLNVGYSLSQDATGEFIGTFAVCSLLDEDPRYHRMPQGKPLERVIHAISRTVIAQHDDGRLMPNYETLFTYPASAEISNLYVPGVHGNGPSTVARIITGLATDPINNLITEFLPDFAKRVHIRIVFVQQIINQVASSQTP